MNLQNFTDSPNPLGKCTEKSQFGNGRRRGSDGGNEEVVREILPSSNGGGRLTRTIIIGAKIFTATKLILAHKRVIQGSAFKDWMTVGDSRTELRGTSSLRDICLLPVCHSSRKRRAVTWETVVRGPFCAHVAVATGMGRTVCQPCCKDKWASGRGFDRVQGDSN